MRGRVTAIVIGRSQNVPQLFTLQGRGYGVCGAGKATGTYEIADGLLSQAHATRYGDDNAAHAIKLRMQEENMVQLLDGDIKTREVLDWKGVHILHFAGSSCSQKLRVFLNLKGIPWQSHPVDLPGNENFRPWFLGITPRGLVPVLVHDGAVHIESNDIIEYLERTYPEPRLIPKGHESQVAALLRAGSIPRMVSRG
jgi:hypothetical protein